MSRVKAYTCVYVSLVSVWHVFISTDVFPVLDSQDKEGAREEAEGLVSKCLLQDVGGGGYRVHDLLLDFVKIKIKADVEMMEKATTLQARFLGRLDVLKGYENPGHGAGNRGLVVLDALWRSVEQLSEDPDLEVASYTTSLRELESCEAITCVASSYASVGFLFNIQVRKIFFVWAFRTVPCSLCRGV